MRRNNELYHFGILGMHWGIRRFQNPDGTLTEEGKKRYSEKEVDQDVQKKMESDSKEAEAIIEKGKQIPLKADELSGHYGEAFKSMTMSEADKEKIWKELYQDFGMGVDDDEYFDYIVGTKLGKYMWNAVPENVQEERKAFEKYQNEYWNQVHSFSEDLINKYKDTKVTSSWGTMTDGQQYVRQAITGNLDTQFNAYISRHFDDYWVFDTKEFNDCENRLGKEFTAEEYNRRFGSKKE